jgi:hypothetical protein
VSEHTPKSLLSPPKSPDLNPIEKVWSVLEQRVCRCKPSTLEQLEAVIRKEWEGLEQGIIDNCIMHTINIIPSIIEQEGGYVEAKRAYRR